MPKPASNWIAGTRASVAKERPPALPVARLLRHKIAPRVSPNKTWEGAIGGCLTTTALFVWLAPYFTPLRDLPVLLLIGGVLPMLGFLGDITMSAIKRDLGVKDASNLLPGHGGILDRVDSLTFTAPWYFHMLAIFALQRF
ncbi:MAG: phosphatidate cytidylyltransferase [Proteobacteria bacterium]|nr:phosphatidate cytidylyltransferase [Pseudomonadota bacterium]